MDWNTKLTKWDLAVTLIIVSAWTVLGFATYHFPQYPALWWLFCASIVITLLPRFVLLLIDIWTIIRTAVFWIQRQLS
jgi:hypothetical protein